MAAAKKKRQSIIFIKHIILIIIGIIWGILSLIPKFIGIELHQTEESGIKIILFIMLFKAVPFFPNIIAQFIYPLFGSIESGPTLFLLYLISGIISIYLLYYLFILVKLMTRRLKYE